MLGICEEGEQEALGMPPQMGGVPRLAQKACPLILPGASLGSVSSPLAPHPGEPRSGPGARTGARPLTPTDPGRVSLPISSDTPEVNRKLSPECSQQWGSRD